MKTRLVSGTFLIVVFALLSATVSAVDFDLTYNVLNDTIYIDEHASYMITVHNDQGFDDTFTLFTIDPTWQLKLDPLSVDVLDGDSDQFKLTVTPRPGLKPGPYLIPIRLVSETTNQDLEENFFLYIKSYTRDDREYLPSVSMSIKLPAEVDPRTKIPIEITMRNRNLLDMDDLQVFIRSDLFQDTYTIPLGPLEDKTQEVLFEIDPLVKADSYRLTVTLKRGEKTVSEISKFFEIIDYSKIIEEFDAEKELFKATTIVEVKNIGNEPKEKIVKIKTDFFKKLFTSTDPEYVLEKEDGKKLLTWPVVLDPQESTSIQVVINYRPLVTVIVILILLIVGYFVFRSPLISHKQARLYGNKTGGISQMKIRLFIKNRTKRPVYNIKVIEKIPGLAEVVTQEATIGTLKPSKVIRHDKAGTIVRWDIEKFEPYEERIITYTIRSKLKLVGKMTLKPVKIKFDTGLGKERAAYSNAVLIEEDAFGAQEQEDES